MDNSGGSMKYLFIGGLAHGEWFEADGVSVCHIRQPSEFVYDRPDEKPLERITPEEIHTYRPLSMYHHGVCQRDIYVESHCTVSEGLYLYDLFCRRHDA